jgi:hypothetical protein
MRIRPTDTKGVDLPNNLFRGLTSELAWVPCRPNGFACPLLTSSPVS